MSIKTIRICDKCKNPLDGRMAAHICPCCGNEICLKCQEKEDAKHVQKAVIRTPEPTKKPKIEQVSTPPAEVPTKLKETRGKSRRTHPSMDTHPLADFEVKTPEPGSSDLRVVRLGFFASTLPNLREAIYCLLRDSLPIPSTVKDALPDYSDIRAYIGGLPEHPNKTLILGILEPEEKG